MVEKQQIETMTSEDGVDENEATEEKQVEEYGEAELEVLAIYLQNTCH